MASEIADATASFFSFSNTNIYNIKFETFIIKVDYLYIQYKLFCNELLRYIGFNGFRKLNI